MLYSYVPYAQKALYKSIFEILKSTSKKAITGTRTSILNVAETTKRISVNAIYNM